MSVHNRDRNVSCCRRCQRHRASHYLWCADCWRDITSEAHLDDWTPERARYEAALLAHLLHLDARPAQAVAR